jgi:hypothetical protein
MQETNEFQQRGDYAIDKSQARQASEEKICPFMSRSGAFMVCTPKCKLYRNLKDFECYFQELRSIAWNTNKKN